MRVEKKISQAERRNLKETTTAVDREKAGTMISDKGKVLKVKVTCPESVPEAIRVAKINRIYDILTKHIAE